MANLIEMLDWTQVPVGVESAFGQINLGIGAVGGGGPVALITAGIHGDEGPWGAWAIRKLLERITPDELRGTIHIVPVSNPLAMQADKRNAPVDQLDLNRAFPGNSTGSYTERVASILVEYALPGADYVIDLHGGGSWCVNAFVFQMEGGEALSAAFEAPFVVQAPDRTVTLTGYARSQGAVVAAVEMGGRSEFEANWADRIADGLFRALAVAGVIEPAHTPVPVANPAIVVSETSVLRPNAGGIFLPHVRADQVGTIVAKDTLLGQMLHPVTQVVIEEFRAPFKQTALLLLRPMLAQIEGGAMTYVVAEPSV